jgi:glycosyltransferase involved in cell wall biosynthesis
MNKKVDILCFNSINAINGPVIIHRSILKHITVFSKRGYDVSIFFKEGIYNKEYKPNEFVTNKSYLNLEFFKLKRVVKDEIIKFYTRVGLLRMASYYFFEYKTKKNVLKYIKGERVADIVITDSEREMYYFLKYKKDKVKSVLFMHTDGVPLKMISVSDPHIERTFFFRRMQKRYEFTTSNVDKIVFICNVGMENFIKSYPNYDRSRLTVILNGIDEKENPDLKARSRSYKTSGYKLLCVGSLSHRKGQDIILEALSNIEPKVLNDIHIDIVGDGPAKKFLTSYIRENNLSRNVNFIGGVDNLKVGEFLARSDIFILMSRNEGLPISIIEAMRSGLPIISTNISGIPELVENGLNGILLKPDVNDLSDLLMQIHHYDWHSMGKISRKIFEEKFTLNRVFSEYCDMYDSLFL